jgi:hypothetical protein
MGTRETTLHELLFNALHNGGYGKLCERTRVLPERTLFNFVVWTSAACAGYVAVGRELELSWPLALLAGVVTLAAIFLAAVIIARGDDDLADTAFLALLGLTLGAGGVFEASRVGWEALLTHAAPALVALLAIAVVHRFELSTVRRTLGVLKRVIVDVPVLFPFIALVMFTLILNAEVWLVGTEQTPLRLAVLAAISIVPLVILLCRRLIKAIDKVVADAASRIKRKAPVDDLVAAVRAMAGAGAGTWVEQNARAVVVDAFRSMDPSTLAKEVCGTLSGTFKRRILTRLVLSVVAVAIAAFLIIYGLAWLLVSVGTVREWTDVDGVEAWVVAGVSVPVGPYPRVAAMLAIIATSIFLAFVLTTDRLLSDFRRAYVEKPASTAMLLVIAYRGARPKQHADHARRAHRPARKRRARAGAGQ